MNNYKHTLSVFGLIVLFFIGTSCGGASEAVTEDAASELAPEPYETYLAEALAEELNRSVEIEELEKAAQQVVQQFDVAPTEGLAENGQNIMVELRKAARQAVQQFNVAPTEGLAENGQNIMELANSSNTAPLLAENMSISREEFQEANRTAYANFAVSAVDQGLIMPERASYEQALLQVDFNQLMNETDEASTYYQLVNEQFERLCNSGQFPPSTCQLLQWTLPCDFAGSLEPEIMPIPYRDFAGSLDSELTSIPHYDVLPKCTNDPYRIPQPEENCLICDRAPWTGSGGGTITWPSPNPIGAGGIVGPGDTYTVGIPTGSGKVFGPTESVLPCHQANDRYVKIVHLPKSKAPTISVTIHTPNPPYLKPFTVPLGNTLKYCGELTGYFTVQARPNAKWECIVKDPAICPKQN